MSQTLYRVADLISSGILSGRVGKAPGTMGSLAFALIWAACGLSNASRTAQFAIILALAVIGTSCVALSLHNVDPARAKRSDTNGKIDPQWIVIDEWLGMALTLIAARPGSASDIAIGFALFRVFDIFKPGPVGWVEKLPGAFGIMADDALAGIAAGALFYLIQAAGMI